MIAEEVLQPGTIIHRNGHPGEGIILDHLLGGPVILDFVRAARESIGCQGAAAGHSIHLLNAVAVPVIEKLSHDVKTSEFLQKLGGLRSLSFPFQGDILCLGESTPLV